MALDSVPNSTFPVFRTNLNASLAEGAKQIGALTAGHLVKVDPTGAGIEDGGSGADATSIQGFPVSSTPATEGQVLQLAPDGSPAVDKWVPTTPSGGSGNYQTVEVDGSAQTQRAKLNLIHGSGVTITPSDNAGADSTDVTIAATGGSGGGIAVTMGAISSLPGSGVSTGDMYLCTDAPYRFVWSGSIWVAYYRDSLVQVPPASGWSWDTQGGSTVDFAHGFLAAMFAGSSTTWRLYYRTAPSTPYSIVTRISKLSWTGGTSASNDGVGLVFRDGSGKFIAFYVLTQGTNQGVLIEKWTNVASFSGSYNGAMHNDLTYGTAQFAMAREIYLKITDTGTDLLFYWSFDGFYWQQFDSRARTDFLSSGPTQIGIGGRMEVGISDGYLVDVFDWSQS